jgi:hypothetical protein
LLITDSYLGNLELNYFSQKNRRLTVTLKSSVWSVCTNNHALLPSENVSKTCLKALLSDVWRGAAVRCVLTNTAATEVVSTTSATCHRKVALQPRAQSVCPTRHLEGLRLAPGVYSEFNFAVGGCCD